MMSKEKRRVPKLRFPGFTEDWEQRKLSDISTKVTRKNVNVHYTETLTNSAEQGIISQVDFFDKEISNKDNINGYYIVDNNDFIYNPRISTLAPVGPINRNKLNRTGIMSPLYTVFRSSNVDLGFLEWYFQSSHWHRYMKLKGDSGARADRIAIKDSTFFEMPIKIPVNIKEQVLIGETLEKFNQYITLHQRKLDNLKLKKKALLQKLFPRNGERYPELRFPGFTDAWEQRKLSELATMNARIGWQNLRTSEFLDSGDYLLITGTDFDNGRIKYNTCHYVEKKRFDQDTKIQLSTGSILITKDGTLGKVALIEELPKPATLNAGVFNVRVKDDAVLSYKYLYHYLKAPFLMKYVTANATGGTIKHLNQSILVDFPIPITEKQEQDRIAKLLDSLESIITLHQRKLEHLQIQKKSLLQKLFV